MQAAAEADMDGSNEHKANDTDITAQFHLLFRKRQESIMAARDMYKVVVAADPARKSAKQLAADRAPNKLIQVNTFFRWSLMLHVCSIVYTAFYKSVNN